MSSVESGPLPQSSPFWTFSLGYYRGAGVSEACLELQDRCGVDVNVVLFLLWLAAQKRGSRPARSSGSPTRCGRGRRTSSARSARCAATLKTDAPLLDKGSAEFFRTRIKAIELEAERLQQEAMFALAADLAAEPAPSAAAAARASIAAYQDALGRPFTPAAVDTLIGALP